MDAAVVSLALGAAFFFGLALVLTQFGLRYTSALRGAAISVPTTTLVFICIALATVDLGKFDRYALLMFFIAGFLFPAPVTLLTFESNRRIGPTLTGALGNLAPLFAVGLATVLLGETPGAGQFLAMLLVLAGVFLLFDMSRTAASRVAIAAMALPLVAAMLRGVVQPVVKLGLEAWPNPIVAVAVGYAVSSLIILGARYLTPSAPAVDESARAHSRRWFIATGFCNGAAVLLLYAALARGPVVIVAPLVACYPLATMALSRLLLGSASLTGRMISGVFVTVTGVALLLVLS